ncbi:hypothetical protein [Natronocalculus amylovorans]|uniref:Uncharacterized protein n=1 Tax=Natronocalculus amylovorans TaxID=2917812 RepID=A0AAE3FUP5_9EURY|nr:hypothetical protein [Natronocalculus amylovorans]MCL9815678.1 hypothetical protein [Natronocalculus amylovorans]
MFYSRRQLLRTVGVTSGTILAGWSLSASKPAAATVSVSNFTAKDTSITTKDGRISELLVSPMLVFSWEGATVDSVLSIELVAENMGTGAQATVEHSEKTVEKTHGTATVEGDTVDLLETDAFSVDNFTSDRCTKESEVAFHLTTTLTPPQASTSIAETNIQTTATVSVTKDPPGNSCGGGNGSGGGPPHDDDPDRGPPN